MTTLMKELSWVNLMLEELKTSHRVPFGSSLATSRSITKLTNRDRRQMINSGPKLDSLHL